MQLVNTAQFLNITFLLILFAAAAGSVFAIFIGAVKSIYASF